MKHDCPHCGTKLAWRLVKSKALAGERRIFPNKAVTVCPACQGQLAQNTHWSEIAFVGFVVIPFLFLPEIRSSLGKSGFLYAGAGFTVFCGATALFFIFAIGATGKGISLMCQSKSPANPAVKRTGFQPAVYLIR